MVASFIILSLSALVPTIHASVEVANVNGRSITDREMNSVLSNYNEGQRQTILKDPASRRQIIENLVDRELLVQEAEKQKLDQSPQFKEALEMFKKQYLANALMEKELAPKVTDSAAKKFYNDNKTRYRTDQLHVQHILLDTEEQAKDVLNRAKAPGADFQALAEKLSKDPSAKNNRGDLGLVGRDRFVPEFTEPVFHAKVGDIIGPVKTSFGYHVIKIIELNPGKQLGFEEVELQAKGALRQQLLQAYLIDLRKKGKIK